MFGKDEKMKIAISGKANSGKNTLSQLLIKNFGFYEYLNCDNSYKDENDCCCKDSINRGGSEVKTAAFADPIKNLILKTFPEAKKKKACLYGSSNLRSEIIDEKYLDKNGNILTFRQALIDLGTLGRQYNKDFWITHLENKVSWFNNSTSKLFICTDARFSNEIDFLKKNNFYIIRIVRNGTNKINDISETEQDGIPNNNFHKVLLNDKSIEDLDNEVKKIIERIKLIQ